MNSAFTTSTTLRFGSAWNVERITPNRYSLVTDSAARIISTSTPKPVTPPLTATSTVG